MSILIENIRNVDSQNLRWCDYLQILGVTSDECKSEDRSPEKARQVERQPQYAEYNLCQGRYGLCTKTNECESGIMCTQTFTNVKCCTSPFTDCPTVDELGYSCRKSHPTNWCLQDRDCSVGLMNKYRCCPTGCNYNVCVRKSNMNSIQLIQAAIDVKSLPPTDCPNVAALKYRCRLAAVGAGTTICRRSVDCSHVGYGMMRTGMNCCPSPCGFGICIHKQRDSSFVIG